MRSKHSLLVFALCLVPLRGFAQSPAAPSPTTQPPTVEDKLEYHVATAYGLMPVLGTFAYDGVLQLENSPREWGQGARGYSKRVVSSLAYTGMRNTIAFGLDSALHQNPIYDRATSVGFWNRTGHALRRVLVTRKDHGGETFASWRVGSAVAANFLSNQWYPDRLNTTSLSLKQSGAQLGWDFLSNIQSEFWPDIKKAFHHH